MSGSDNTQIAKLRYLIGGAAKALGLTLSVPMTLNLATEISAMIDAEGMCLCWMSDFEEQLKAIEAKDTA